MIDMKRRGAEGIKIKAEIGTQEIEDTTGKEVIIEIGGIIEEIEKIEIVIIEKMITEVTIEILKNIEKEINTNIKKGKNTPKI